MLVMSRKKKRHIVLIRIIAINQEGREYIMYSNNLGFGVQISKAASKKAFDYILFGPRRLTPSGVEANLGSQRRRKLL